MLGPGRALVHRSKDAGAITVIRSRKQSLAMKRDGRKIHSGQPERGPRVAVIIGPEDASVLRSRIQDPFADGHGPDDGARQAAARWIPGGSVVG